MSEDPFSAHQPPTAWIPASAGMSGVGGAPREHPQPPAAGRRQLARHAARARRVGARERQPRQTGRQPGPAARGRFGRRPALHPRRLGAGARPSTRRWCSTAPTSPIRCTRRRGRNGARCWRCSRSAPPTATPTCSASSRWTWPSRPPERPRARRGEGRGPCSAACSASCSRATACPRPASATRARRGGIGRPWSSCASAPAGPTPTRCSPRPGGPPACSTPPP